jgi:hypothetical protein
MSNGMSLEEDGKAKSEVLGAASGFAEATPGQVVPTNYAGARKRLDKVGWGSNMGDCVTVATRL